MYGVEADNGKGRDISIGYVHDVWYVGNPSSREWFVSDAPVGFFNNIWKKSSPSHE